MDWKLLVLILMTIGHAYRMVLHIVSRRSAGNPTPANVADVYDAETYQRWKQYSAEKNRLSMFSTALSFVVSLVLLALAGYSAGGSFSAAALVAALLFVASFGLRTNVMLKHGEGYM